MNEEINRRLRAAAEAYEPNRASILARVERGMADPAVRRTRSIVKPGRRATIAALIATATLATGGLAVAAIGGVPLPPAASRTPVAPPPTITSTPTPTPTPAPTPSARTTTSPPPAITPPSSRPTPLPDSRIQNGPLWSQGSIDPRSNPFWAQNDLILKTTRPLTSLTVELRIAQTGGVQKTGNWRTLPADDFAVTVEESEGTLLYRWVLKPGRSVPTGQHEFAAQYNHAPGDRKGKRDTYRVRAKTSDGSSTVWGGFAPPR